MDLYNAFPELSTYKSTTPHWTHSSCQEDYPTQKHTIDSIFIVIITRIVNTTLPGLTQKKLFISAPELLPNDAGAPHDWP